MRQFLISITALLASMSLLLVGGGLMGTAVSVRLSFDAVDPQIKGLILAAYYIGLVVGSQQAGRVIRHAGHIRAFAIFAAVSTAAILLQGMYVLPAVWFVARVVIGFSTAGIYMVVESWLNERSDPGNRGRVFSVYQIISYVALGLGQFLMHLGDPAGAELFMVVAILFALCLVPVALSRASNPPEPTPHTPMALRQTVTGAPLAAWTCFASGLISGAIFTLTPAFGVRLGLDVGAVATLMASLILGGVVLQWPIGHLSDRYGRRPVILAVGFISAMLAAVIGFAGARMPFEALLVSAAVFGGFSFTFYPLAVSQANDTIASASDFVAIAGALLFLWGIGAAAGPIAAGWVINRTGDPGLFVYVGIVALTTGVVAWILQWESVIARYPYRTLSRTTAVITELDPRAQGDATDPSRAEHERLAATSGDDSEPPVTERP